MTNARNLANRSTDFVSVKDFGAVGDGVADDTAAIQAAISYALSSKLGQVWLPDVYKVTSTIVVPSGVALVGSEKTETDAARQGCILYTGTTACIQISNAPASSFQHLTRITNLSLKYTGVTAGVVGIRQEMSSVNLENVRIFDFTSHGLHAGTCILSTYSNLRVLNCGGTGIYLKSENAVYPGGQCVFINPQSLNNAYGFHAENYQAVTVIGGTIAINSNQQARILGSELIFFDGTQMEGELSGGAYTDKLIEIAGTTISATPLTSNNITIINCQLQAGQSAYNYGVHIGNARNVRVQHNSFANFATAAVKVVFDTNIVTQCEVGPNRYFNCTAEFDRAGSSSTAEERKLAAGVVTRTITNENITLTGTGVLTVQGTYSAPMLQAATRFWVDSDGKLLRKNSAPVSATDGTSASFGGTQTTVGAAGAASALPANPTGYAKIRIAGTEYVIPYYAAS